MHKRRPTSIFFVTAALISGLASAQKQVRILERAGQFHVKVDGVPLRETRRRVSDVELLEIEGREELILTWSEQARNRRRIPHYRISRDGRRWSRVRQADHLLRTRRADFDPLAPAPDSRAPDWAESPLPPSARLFIVQYHTQPLQVFEERLADLGGSVLRFLPGQAHIVDLSEVAAAAAARLPFVRWVGPYHPEMRLDPLLLAALKSAELTGQRRYVIQLADRSAATRSVVGGRLQQAGAILHEGAQQGLMLEATLAPELLRSLLAWDEVIYVDGWSPARTYMDKVRVDGGADHLEAITGFTGQGVAGEVMDIGLKANHQDFQSNPPIIHGGNSTSTSHGTPVAGIVFGDGSGNASARGLMPDGKHVFAAVGAAGNRYLHTAELLQPPYECVFQTNSWGWGYGDYSNQTTALDDIAFLHDIVILQAQGNSGGNSSEQLSWAKNVLSVGGIVHNNTQTTADDFHMGAGGSTGPAPDGRIKPDISFWYDQILCPSSSGGYTSSFGGTSAATPETAGHVGLLHQMWHHDLFNQGAAGATVFESRPKATTARAMLINTAQQYDFAGGSADLRRIHQGWGRPNVQRLYELRDKFFVIDETEVLGNLESISFDLEVAPGEGELRATLVYLDPAGTTSSSQHRINDLSLRVTSPSGDKYWGNRGMKTATHTAPGGNSNKLDPVENVWVQNPVAGTWTVRVIADEINQDGHTETAALDADFALVVSGVTQSDCQAPINFCLTSANSVGSGAQMGSSGSLSVAANDLTLTTTGVPPAAFGVYLYSHDQGSSPAGDGTLCLGAPTTRLAVVSADAGGVTSFDLDLTNLPAGGTIQSGDTVYFQLWYRDPWAGLSGSNLSDGLQATFCD